MDPALFKALVCSSVRGAVSLVASMPGVCQQHGTGAPAACSYHLLSGTSSPRLSQIKGHQMVLVVTKLHYHLISNQAIKRWHTNFNWTKISNQLKFHKKLLNKLLLKFDDLVYTCRQYCHDYFLPLLNSLLFFLETLHIYSVTPSYIMSTNVFQIKICEDQCNRIIKSSIPYYLVTNSCTVQIAQ